MLRQLAVEAVAAQRRGVADDNEFHAGACHGDIHAAQVVQEAYLSLGIASHQTDDYHVAFLPLEAVYGADGDVMFQFAEVVLHFQQSTQQACLSTIRSDDAEVDALVLNLLCRNHFDVIPQHMNHQAGLLAVAQATGTGSFLGAFRGVNVF